MAYSWLIVLVDGFAYTLFLRISFQMQKYNIILIYKLQCVMFFINVIQRVSASQLIARLVCRGALFLVLAEYASDGKIHPFL